MNLFTLTQRLQSGSNRSHNKDLISSTRPWKKRCLCHPSMFAVVTTLFGTCSLVHALTINATFDATIINDPQSAKIQATINSAIAVFQFNFSDPVTVSIKFQEMTTGLGASSTFVKTVLYPDYRAALATHVTTLDDATALAGLPSTANNPVNNNPNVILKYPLARALGFTANPPSVSLLSPGDPSVGIKVGIMNPSSEDTATDAFRAARARDLQLPGSGASSLSPDAGTAQPDGVISLNTAIMNLSPTDPIDTTKYLSLRWSVTKSTKCWGRDRALTVSITETRPRLVRWVRKTCSDTIRMAQGVSQRPLMLRQSPLTLPHR